MSAIQQMLVATAGKRKTPTYEGITAYATGSNSATVAAVTSAYGSLILLLVWSHKGISLPSGYTLLQSTGGGYDSEENDNYLAVYWKKATGTDSTTAISTINSGGMIGAAKVSIANADVDNTPCPVVSSYSRGGSAWGYIYPEHTVDSGLFLGVAGLLIKSANSFTVGSYSSPPELVTTERLDANGNWAIWRHGMAVVTCPALLPDTFGKVITFAPSRTLTTGGALTSLIVQGAF